MTKAVSNIFTYNQFEDHIKLLINFAKQEHYLKMALGTNIENSLLDAHIALLADMFPENNENYLVDYQEFWGNWSEIVECAIVSFIYGVVDYIGNGEVVASYNHELCSLDGTKISLHSAQMLWRICTGEIAVKERI